MSDIIINAALAYVYNKNEASNNKTDKTILIISLQFITLPL